MEKVIVTPWPGGGTPAETDIRQKMADDGLRPYTWANGPGDVYAAHTHSYHKVIYVVYGSITFGLPALGQKISLQTGDRLDLAAGVLHDAVVGPAGVVCLEAQAS